ncbi:hypothetical protein AYI68_g2584 [Smittium mucronatum]|uniref:Uncharacterized protein n=1 Tax=Smittium mucronatum TaxID=133383 RepID=A0A1R0H2D3_9FUNG|nr:hypothetical protein AYI68_g2584 [Smittium mucronatum]
MIDGEKKYIFLNKSSQLTLLTPSLTGISYRKTNVEIGNLRRYRGTKLFRTWELVDRNKNVHTESATSGILGNIFRFNGKSLEEFTVIWRLASNHQEKQVMSQIDKLIT